MTVTVGWCDHADGCGTGANMCFAGYGYALYYCEAHCPGFHDGSPCFQEHHPENVPEDHDRVTART